ncbi:MAG: hypothetical protein WBW33_09285 [Bryobacteraceae bacterium]
MHGRIRRKVLPEIIGTRLTIEEKERVTFAASAQGLTPSEYVRKTLLDSLDISIPDRMILAEICATRREIERLLQLISDLTASDIDRARSDADVVRRALVEGRISEMKRNPGGLPDWK